MVRKLSAASALNGQANAQRNQGEKDLTLQSNGGESRLSKAEESGSSSPKGNTANEEQDVHEEELARVSLIAATTENSSETVL